MTLSPSDLKTSSKAALNLELGVPISEQELDLQSPILQLPSQVPCLLGHLGAGRLAGTASQVNPPATDLDKEEDVEPGQPDCVHGEEVAGQDLVGVLVDELAPGPLAAPRGGRQTVAAEHFADGPVGAAMAQLAQLALDTPVPPARVPLGQLHDEVMQLAAEDASLAARPSPVSGPPAAEQLSGSREARYVPTVGPARTSLAFPTQARIPRVHGDFARFLPAPSPPAMGFFPSRREVEAYQRGIPM